MAPVYLFEINIGSILIQSEASDNNGIAEDLATEVGKFKLE